MHIAELHNAHTVSRRMHLEVRSVRNRYWRQKPAAYVAGLATGFALCAGLCAEHTSQ